MSCFGGNAADGTGSGSWCSETCMQTHSHATRQMRSTSWNVCTMQDKLVRTMCIWELWTEEHTLTSGNHNKLHCSSNGRAWNKALEVSSQGRVVPVHKIQSVPRQPVGASRPLACKERQEESKPSLPIRRSRESYTNSVTAYSAARSRLRPPCGYTVHSSSQLIWAKYRGIGHKGVYFFAAMTVDC